VSGLLAAPLTPLRCVRGSEPLAGPGQAGKMVLPGRPCGRNVAVPHISVIFGLLLIALGVGGFVGTGSEHLTALIPAGFGLALALLGVVALKDSLRKHAMHLAAMVGLVGAVGGAVMVVLPLVKGTGIERPVAYSCQTALTVLCLVFVGLCVNSFVQARRRRAAAP
jgi:hypothetical protein